MEEQPTRTVTTEQIARLVRYARPNHPDFVITPSEPYCYLCNEWLYSFVSRHAVEEFGAIWNPREGFEAMEVWMLGDLFEPVFTPDDAICVVPRHVVKVSLFGASPSRPLVPVHMDCFYMAILNGRRRRGLEERTCRHCGRTFYSRHAIDWCHVCEPVERTCQQCGGPLRPTRHQLAAAVGIEPRQDRARSDARYCSGRCRVAAHRATDRTNEKGHQP